MGAAIWWYDTLRYLTLQVIITVDQRSLQIPRSGPGLWDHWGCEVKSLSWERDVVPWSKPLCVSGFAGMRGSVTLPQALSVLLCTTSTRETERGGDFICLITLLWVKGLKTPERSLKMIRILKTSVRTASYADDAPHLYAETSSLGIFTALWRLFF